MAPCNSMPIRPEDFATSYPCLCFNSLFNIKSNVHTEQMEFQESDYFKEKSKERYKIIPC